MRPAHQVGDTQAKHKEKGDPDRWGKGVVLKGQRAWVSEEAVTAGMADGWVPRGQNLTKSPPGQKRTDLAWICRCFPLIPHTSHQPCRSFWGGVRPRHCKYTSSGMSLGRAQVSARELDVALEAPFK